MSDVPREFTEEIAALVSQSIAEGLLDTTTIDVDGKFSYTVTKKGEQVTSKIVEIVEVEKVEA